jgi:hypothetical protein
MPHVLRVIGAALAAGTLLGFSAIPAAAWPLPLTTDQIQFINGARGAGFPGDDDQLLLAISSLNG